jgi:hypothetical protein
MSRKKLHTCILSVEGKECYKCKIWKPLSDFSKNKNKWDGLTSGCKECHRRIYEQNKNVIQTRIYTYRRNNLEKVKRIDKESRNRRKEFILENKRKYYLTHKEKIKEYQRRYKRDRRLKDLNYCLRNNIARRILWSLKYYGIKKKLKTINLLGCDIETFKKYTEQKFKDGMNWDNYGYRGWQIDHIIPCSSFDLTNEENQVKCFHYTNTQPLWWWENLSKGDKYEPVEATDTQ